MPPKGTSVTPATRSSTRTKASPLDQTVPAPVRATRSAKGASTAAGAALSIGPQTSSKTRAAAAASEIAAKRLRPLSDRNGTAAPKPLKPADKNPAAMLAATKKALRPVTIGKLEDREPIKAYLRVRPDLSNDGSSNLPYLALVSPTEAQMSLPTTTSTGMTNSRIPTLAARRQIFSFTQVFSPNISQSAFFANTTLPLIKDLLNAENGLLFAYGVTNSGKTYTIQGKNNSEEAGILPRALDVVFNSIEGLQDTSDDLQQRASQDAPGTGESPTVDAEDQFLRSLLPESEQGDWFDRDDTVVPVDRQYTYKIYISYVEIYNNQIFDLLGSSESASNANAGPTLSQPSPNIPSGVTRGSLLPASLSSSNVFSWIGNGGTSLRNVSSSTSRPALTPSQSTGNPNPHTPSIIGTGTNSGSTTILTRRALPLRTNPTTGQKYIHAQTSLQVRSAAEAKTIVRMGQVNRRVFGTLANKESSRSHAVLEVRVERARIDDSSIVDSAKLSIVDLAGSERNKNTQATGDRMGEANKINSSLMVLGQCMRILRSNQKKLAKITRGDRPVRTEIPPYRLSKLTEMFQEFFEGRGRAVMIVNVNPFDTGYHENSAVMEFAALASEVSTVTTKLSNPPRGTAAKGVDSGATEAVECEEGRKAPTVRQVRVSLAGMKGTAPVERVFEIIEEAEEHNDDDGDHNDNEEDGDTLVARLFEELETMRTRWYDAEIRCALIEAETRESVMQEMEERMRLMERMHAQRLRKEVEENELKMDRKIEMLSRTGAFGGDEDNEDTDEMSDMNDVESSLLLDNDRESTVSPTPASKDDFLVDLHQSASSAQNKSASLQDSVALPAPDPNVGVPVPSVSELPPLAAEVPEDSDFDGSEDEEYDDGKEDEASDEEWLPTSRVSHQVDQDREGDNPSPRKGRVVQVSTAKSKATSSASTSAPAPEPKFAEEGRTRGSTEVEPRGIKTMNVSSALDPNESLDEPAIVPNRKAQKLVENNIGEGGKYVPDVGEPVVVKKKKRNLGGAKGSVLSEDDILQVTAKVESGGNRKSGSVRRLDRATK